MSKLGIVVAMIIGVGAGAGCGGAQKTGPTQESRCSAATGNMGQVMAAVLTQAGETVAADTVPDMVAGLNRTCVADVWSDAALACTTTAKTEQDLGACQQHYTEAQLDAIKATIDGTMREATGAGMQSSEEEPEGGSRGGDPCDGDGADPCGGGE